MVFVYYLTRREGTSHSQATRFFRDVNNQKYKAVTTTFTRSEYISVLKAVLAETSGSPPSPTAMAMALDTFDRFVVSIGVEVQDSDRLVGTGFAPLFSECENVCMSSDPIRGTRDGNWRTVGGADALLIIFAERSKADVFATFDQGYKGMKRPALRPLMLPEIYH